MDLILEVISPSPSALGGAARQTFSTSGGTIGRDSGNTWVLPHPKVSGRHAVITWANGVFYLEDTSRNGVCVNSSRKRLNRGEPHPLAPGDRLLIDPYEIRVMISADDASSRGRVGPSFDADPFDLLGDPAMTDPFAPQPARSPVFETPGLDAPESMSREEVDPLALLNLQEDRPAPRKAPSARDLDAGMPLDEYFRPPAAVPDARPARPADPHAIPLDYDPLAPDEPAAPSPPPRRPLPPRPPAAERAVPPPPRPPAVERAAPPPVVERAVPPPIVERPASIVERPASIVEPAAPPAEPESPSPRPRSVKPLVEAVPAEPASAASAGPSIGRQGFDIAAMLQGAGLNPADVTPELARAFGAIIRVVVSGVMDVLQSRRQIKDEFRMRMTQFRPAENNPLKFSANVDDALHNLLVKRNAAYVGPVEAFEDAFAELRNHQLAMLAGMRVAFESMLAEFDPDRLQADFDRQANKGLVPAKMRYWDLFRDKRREMTKDPEATFRELFGEAFARAYEQQLKQLKDQAAGAGGDDEKKPREPSDS